MFSLLRVESLFVRTDRDCHVWCKFLPSYTCRNTIYFVTLKVDSLFILYLGSNNCLNHRNLFQNGVNFFLKMVHQFLPKSCKFCIFLTMRFCSNFTSMRSKYLSKNVWRDFRLQMSVSVMVT